MKLIIQDVQEYSVDLEEPEITIADKKNPSRIYSFSPAGGFLRFVADYDVSLYRVDADLTSEIIEVKFPPRKI